MISRIVIGKCKNNDNDDTVASTSLALSSSGVNINLETKTQMVFECLHVSDNVIRVPDYDEIIVD